MKDIEKLRATLLALTKEYIAGEMAWGDAPMIEIDPATFATRIVDEEENEALDYVDLMDLLHMSVSNPGAWEPDEEAIDEVAESYR